jgi:hypothetical protein
MIAHRLNTIKTAENLLHFVDNSRLDSATKGTKEYEEIINEISKVNYAHQVENEGDSPK